MGRLTLITTILIFLLTGCQIPRPAPAVGVARASGPPPLATFVSPRDRLQVRVGEPVQIDGYFASRNKLGALEIFVNGQPVRAEQFSELAGAFPARLATVRVLVNGHPVAANPVHTPYPRTTWQVSVLWIGRVRGTYILSMQVTDNAQLTSDLITQRIEVQ